MSPLATAWSIFVVPCAIVCWLWLAPRERKTRTTAALDPRRAFTRQEFVIVAQLDGLRCARPGCAGTDLQVDHIVPWSCGGRTTIENAQLLCAYHNGLKSNRFVG